ncbi:hypothetical protein JCM10213_006847 [Rhodosporidiobolus nylandii]
MALQPPVVEALRQRPRSHSPRPALVRALSSSSVAGDATFVATPPPVPSPMSRSRAATPEPVEVGHEPEEEGPLSPIIPHPPPSTNSPYAGAKLVARDLRRRPRLSALFSLLAFAFFVYRFAPPTLDLFHLAHYKLRDRAYDERWGWPLAPPCSMRKKPVIWVRGGETAAVVWETRECGADMTWGLAYRRVERTGGQGEPVGADVEVAPLVEEAAGRGARMVYSAVLPMLRSGERYAYEILRFSSLPASRSTVHRGDFPWIGSSPSSPDDIARATLATTLHIACLADNQFNLRVFRRILRRASSFAGSLASAYFTSAPPSFINRGPHLLLHAGDVVQNPHNLAQWQTDLWDPLTRALSSLPPVLLARGNHDWDPSGSNLYTGGLSSSAALREDWAAHLGESGLRGEDEHFRRRGTYYSISPHPRFRVLVLDSNLPTLAEQEAQERWLEWELARDEWTRASARAVVVHTAPWIEWWDESAWNEGGEKEWSSYVRQRLLPQLARSHCNLVLSGHSHTYTRGFLPYSLVPTYSSAPNSSSVPPLASAAARARAWERTPAVRRSGAIDEPGVLLVTFGGAGGTLDTDRVEDWGFMSKSVSGRHHFGWLAAGFSSTDGTEPGSHGPLDRELVRRRGRGEAPRVYRSARVRRCRPGEREVRDAVEWRVVGVEGKELDRVWMIADGCA